MSLPSAAEATTEEQQHEMLLWQRERYERLIAALGDPDDLTSREQRFLSWLASFDFDAETGLLAVIRRVRSGSGEVSS